MDERIEAEPCDGLAATSVHNSGACEAIRAVVPELRRRGVFRGRNTNETLIDSSRIARSDAVYHG
jgi:hypothetical protein